MDTDVIIKRTPDIVAAEINNIKDQTRKMVLCNSIEIGKRLCEAKEMIEHGEWGQWLDTTVNYSQSTANNLMNIFKEYGAAQGELFGASAKSQTLGNLSYSQAVALLGIAPEERETFVKENKVDELSTRELQKLIKERDEALAAKEEAAKQAQVYMKEKERAEFQATRLNEDLKEQKRLKEQIEEEIASQQSKISTLETSLQEQHNNDVSERIKAELDEAQAEIGRLKKELDKPITVEAPQIIEKIPDEIEKELAELRERAKNADNRLEEKAVLQYKVHFESLTLAFNNLLNDLSSIKDIEMQAKYRQATIKLIEAMSAKCDGGSK